MSEILRTTHRGRPAVSLESGDMRVVVTLESANIAAIEHRPTGINPLWSPPWDAVELATPGTTTKTDYGGDDEAPVLARIMGHSICLDTYGGPSPEESAAGMPIHGEGIFTTYEADWDSAGVLTLKGVLPLAGIRFERQISLSGTGVMRVVESLENLTASDRPIAWTQHVTLGPPYLEPGKTQFRAPATRSKVIDSEFGGEQATGKEFTWPTCPRKDGGTLDLRVYPSEVPSGGFTTHLIDPSLENGYFTSWAPASGIYFGYVWKRADFPWLCRWGENSLRKSFPWNGRTMTCGMEFSASPELESRRAMATRGSMWGAPAGRWLPAKTKIETSYAAFIGQSRLIPESVEWDGDNKVQCRF